MQNENNDDPQKQARLERRQKNYESLMISPMRQDAFDENTTEIPFADAMKEADYQKKKKDIVDTIIKDNRREEPPKKRSRWDKSSEVQSEVKKELVPTPTPTSRNTWDETPGRQSSCTPRVNQWEETPSSKSCFKELDSGFRTPAIVHSRFDETPRAFGDGSDTPRRNVHPEMSVRDDLKSVNDTPRTTRRSRWDDTPQQSTRGETPSRTPSMTPGLGFTPSGATPSGNKASFLSTPSHTPRTAEQLIANRYKIQVDERNKFLTDAELDEMLPEGFKILRPPPGYSHKAASQKITGTPTPFANNGFVMASPKESVTVNKALNELALGVSELENGMLLKPEDIAHFEFLLENKDERLMTPKEKKKKEILNLVLRYKNGLPTDRRSARRELTKRAEEFGPQLLFELILPILLNPTLEDQERYLLVKLLNLFLYKLEDKVRPYTHKVLVVIIPMLIDEERITRQVGKEVLSNLAKAVGLSTMITALRPDLDNPDEGVRKVCATALAIVGHSLGLNALLPFLKAVCKSKKSWQARHTGIRIVHQLAIMLKCSILPYLNRLIPMVEGGLEDEQQQVRSITALTVAALAESSAPYGLYEFDSVLKPLWKGIRQYRGKNLAAYLKAIGFVVALMECAPDYASYYIKETMIAVIREFQTPDETMKDVILNVLIQCCRCGHMESSYINEEILPPFFKHFWNGRNANNHKLQESMVNIAVELAAKVQVMPVLTRIIMSLKDESEQFRRLCVEAIDKIICNHGTDLIDDRTEKVLVDSLMVAFNEQTNDQRNVMINSYGSIMKSLGLKCIPYLPEICIQATFRMGNKSAKTRQQAADIISKIAPVIKMCGEERRLIGLGQFMFENLGEEYPDVLGSVLKALDAIVRAVGVMNINPPISELLPRLTPILKNRQEKVQEGCLELVGYIAEMAGDQVNSREWMRIAFDLIAIFSSPKKSIRRASINTFGYIASAVGPLDVLGVLLNNLKVQDRQNRVCATIAIAVVAEVCRPFNALAAVMNEYRTPDMNVQNGVLKSLSFMFEYIGDVSKDYIYAITPLLAEAVTERDIVHRQTAISAIGHLTLGVYGYSCEDALIHLLNCVWPNCLETSPHMEQVFIRCMEGFGISLGVNMVLPYLTQGMYHPAQAVRRVCWKIYNAIYMQNQDGLVCSYPQVDDEKMRTYTRYELHYKL